MTDQAPTKFPIQEDFTAPHTRAEILDTAREHITDLVGDISTSSTVEDDPSDVLADDLGNIALADHTAEDDAYKQHATEEARRELFADTEPKIYLQAAEQFAEASGLLASRSFITRNFSNALPELCYGYAMVDEFERIDQLIEKFGQSSNEASEQSPDSLENMIENMTIIELTARASKFGPQAEKAEKMRSQIVDEILNDEKYQRYNGSSHLFLQGGFGKAKREEILAKLSAYTDRKIEEFYKERREAFEPIATPFEERVEKNIEHIDRINKKYAAKPGYNAIVSTDPLTDFGTEADYLEAFIQGGPEVVRRTLKAALQPKQQELNANVQIPELRRNLYPDQVAERVLRAVTEFAAGRQRQLLSEVAA